MLIGYTIVTPHTLLNSPAPRTPTYTHAHTIPLSLSLLTFLSPRLYPRGLSPVSLQVSFSRTSTSLENGKRDNSAHSRTCSMLLGRTLISGTRGTTVRHGRETTRVETGRKEFKEGRGALHNDHLVGSHNQAYIG